jgi:hypothetical protein
MSSNSPVVDLHVIAPEVLKVSEVPEVPDVIKVSEVPEVIKVSEFPVIPEVLKVPKTKAPKVLKPKVFKIPPLPQPIPVVKIVEEKIVNKVELDPVVVLSRNALYKQYIADMPDVLDTLKDIIEYAKDFKKINKDHLYYVDPKLKKLKVKKGFDKDGNIKEKRAPTFYNIFVKNQFPIIKNTNPELDNKEIFKEIKKVWKNRKHDVKNE